MGTFEADMDASEAWIDEQEARLLGLPEGTRRISADEMRKRIPLEDLQASDDKRDRLTKHREAYHHEFRLRMSDASERLLTSEEIASSASTSTSPSEKPQKLLYRQARPVCGLPRAEQNSAFSSGA
jgi:hypothetical protein